VIKKSYIRVEIYFRLFFIAIFSTVTTIFYQNSLIFLHCVHATLL
jgi:hypothetical protein